MLSFLNINDARKIRLIDYVSMFLLLTVSGIPVFNGSSIYLAAVFAFNLGRFVLERRKFDPGFFLIVFGVFALAVAQYLWFSNGNAVSYGGLILKITTAYLAIKNIDAFVEVFIRVLFALTIIAIVLFLVFNVFHSIEDTLYGMRNVWDDPLSDQNKHLIIYNIHREETFGTVDKDTLGLFGLTRNAGPFWEPGAFGGFLTLGIMFEFLTPGPHKKLRLLVFFAALFTTFSTTAWMSVLLFFLMNYTIINNKDKTLILLLPFLVVASFLIVANVDFLGEKITKQFQSFTDSKKYGGAADDDSRLGSAALDFEDFKRSPIVGSGPSTETRYGPREQLFLRTNGVTDFLVRFGPIGFIAFFVMLSGSMKLFYEFWGIDRYKQAATVTVIMIVVMALSETYYNLPFFWSLIFLRYNEMDET